ncbi:ATG16 [Candida margitis]|uniref:ATG16 n=1 Tax=Candida margitis TaxID=1775924 RepID=UPI002225E2C2|nr:ATG16 [Candida margitis]KAI5969768.1 ATG16 [Candida margitis]
MSTETWSDGILKRLQVRDEIEKKDSQYYYAFQHLVEKLQLEQQQQQHQQQKQGNSDDQIQSPFTSKSPSPSTVLSIDKGKAKPTSKSTKSKTATVDKTNDNNDATAIIIKENYQLRSENEDLISNLNSITLKNEKLEAMIREKDRRIGKLEKLSDKLQNLIDHLNLEMKEKNKTIELINDENLTNQIQLNVLRDKLDKK